MKILANLIWAILGGWSICLGYILGGVILCCTIIGIPFGIQLFKISILGLFPFGKRVVTVDYDPGCTGTIMNILWILCGGIWIALMHLKLGVLLCLTIVGIPFGMQHFKLMSLAFAPFGKNIMPERLD